MFVSALLAVPGVADPSSAAGDDLDFYNSIYDQGGHSDCFGFNPAVQQALATAKGTVCFRAPLNYQDRTMAEYDPIAGTITFVTETILAQQERDNPAAGKIAVYEEGFHATQNWDPLKRFKRLEDCLDADPPGSSGAGSQARQVWNAVQAAADLNVYLNEMQSQLDQVCNRAKLCGPLTEQTKETWKNCIKFEKEYFSENSKAAKEAAQRLGNALALANVTGNFDFNCNDGSTFTVNVDVVQSERDDACDATDGTRGEIGEMDDKMKAKCAEIDAELKAVCK